MLVHLHVKNLALIEDIEVDFGPGLNILTGETGAGKSILLGSLQLILGSRISRDMIRENASHALVELLFQVENPETLEQLKALEIMPEEGQVLLSRKILNGRSINRINGETCTVSQMKAAASLLLDIHGQREQESLLYEDKQLEILDAYGKDTILPVREKVEKAFRIYRECVQAKASLDMDPEQRNREKAFLQFEVKEIDSAGLLPGEDEELEKLYKKLSNGKEIAQSLQEAHSFTGYEEGAGDLVGNALHELNRVAEYDEELESLSDSLQEVDALLNDFNRELSSYLENLTFDDEQFYNTEKRLDQINSLKARYGRTIGDILEYREKQAKKLDKLLRYDEHVRRADENLKKAAHQLERFCTELTRVRKEAAGRLSEEVKKSLQDLNFLDVNFLISFERRKGYTSGGVDAITYQISTNPGEPLKPLGQIVSGGELSRIMLALRAILADKDRIETLIFDEIDAGISGRTAQKVSEKMALIGRSHQVLCITHLPQIAAMADTHFEIEKHQRGEETITEIHVLEGEDSIRELARLLGGAKITDAVMENAREMKQLAQDTKRERN